MPRMLWITDVDITDATAMKAVLAEAQAAGAGEIIHLPAPWLGDKPPLGYFEIADPELPEPTPTPTLSDVLKQLDALRSQVTAAIQTDNAAQADAQANPQGGL